MSTKPVSLGPWSGVDNFHAPDHRVFQPPARGEPPARLVAATDVDLDDEGLISSRPWVTEVMVLAAGKNLFSALDVLLIQDGASIKQIDTVAWAATNLVTGLTAGSVVAFHEFDGHIFWTDSYSCGMIDVISGVAQARPWGAMPPSFAVSDYGLGNPLAAPFNEYQWAVTTVDAYGVESGASPMVVAWGGEDYIPESTEDPNAEVPSKTYYAAAPSFFVGSYDPHAARARLYMSRGPGSPLFYICDGPIDEVLYTDRKIISQLPLQTVGMQGPIPGYGVFSYHKTLCTYRGRWIYPSTGRSFHLFSPQTFSIQVPYTVCAAQGVGNGMWVATEGGMFWISGDSKDSLTTVQKDHVQYMRGSLLVSASDLPSLETSGQIALFVREDWVVAGLSDGRLVYLTDQRYNVGGAEGKKAVFSMMRRSGINQIGISIIDTEAEVEDYVPPMVPPSFGAGAEIVILQASRTEDLTMAVEELETWIPGVPHEVVAE